MFETPEGNHGLSDIAWLDTSPDEERQMREIAKLFFDSSTLDDIGIGQVRDSLADRLFPATSTVHTRARYFLFIPWIYEAAAEKWSGTQATSKARDQERTLIETMKKFGHTKGLIGRVAGASVATLPSNIYWSALANLGIREQPPGGGTTWNVSVDPPPGFPKAVDDGFDLSAEEAKWLQERVLTTKPTSYLAHILRSGLDTDITSIVWPWDHPALDSASNELQVLVEHARLFSLAMEGASLLYNLLLAEKYDALVGPDDQWAPYYAERLETWAAEVDNDATALAGWDLDNFWRSAEAERNAPIPNGTRLFVQAWIDEVTAGRAANAAESEPLRTMIAKREHQNKGEQSRLRKDNLIKQWSGASGANRLAYRWPTVQTLVTDIREGLAHAAS